MSPKLAQVLLNRLEWDGKDKTWLITSFDDMRGKFLGSAKTSDIDTFDSAEMKVLSANLLTSTKS
jgi:hypothetical protein